MADKMPKNLNIEDIARLSGYSRSTVSRVVNGHPNVSEQALKRISAVIEQHNFKPNPAARALASQQLNIIGILIPHIVSEIFSDPFFPLLIQAITTTANQHDYGVTLWLSSAEVDRSTFYNQVFNPRLADGLVIASAVVDYPFLDKLDSVGKPYVIVGRPNVRAEQTNYVDSDSVQGGYLVTRHLIEQGYRRIGLIPGLQKLTPSQDRERGFRKAMEEAGLATDFIGPPGNFSEMGGFTSMQHLLGQKVEAVFCASDSMAVGAMRAIRAAGLKIPDDVAVAGFDDIGIASVTGPPLTTVRQSIKDLGSSAVEGLLRLLKDKVEAPYQRVFPVELVVRKSTVR